MGGFWVLNYLKRKFAGRDDVRIVLIEKNDYPGGTIRTFNNGHMFFEYGPNGFLSSRETTLEFAKEIGLEDALIFAQRQAKERYILLGDTLFAFPLNPLSFLSFKPFSLRDKLRVFYEIFVPKGANPDETVYDFGKRRLGEKFSELFLDPMVSGVFGGDARRLNLKCAFPRIYEIEQTYGSLFKGMIHLALTKKSKRGEKRINVEPKGVLTSFKKGMGQLIEALYDHYRDAIHLREEAGGIIKKNNRFIVQTNKREFSCDEAFLCVPAHNAAQILYNFNKILPRELRRISYAPIAVVGLAYAASAFEKMPRGFGYLIPSRENKEILGCLFSSNIFEGRCAKDYFLCQILIGGARNPAIADYPKEKLVAMAKTEVSGVLRPKGDAAYEFFAFWPKGIPQYDNGYPQVVKNIQDELNTIKGLHLTANYLGGVALNDCILNAKLAAEKLVL